MLLIAVAFSPLTYLWRPVLADRPSAERLPVRQLLSLPEGGPVLVAAGSQGLWRCAGNRMTRLSAGRTDGLDVAERNPSLIVRVGGVSGSFSGNGGQSWTPFSNPSGTIKAAGSIAVSATGQFFVWSPGGARAFRSEDVGIIWEPCNGSPISGQVVADRKDGARFYDYEPSTGALYVSGDEAASFVLKHRGLPKHGRLYATPSIAKDLWLAAGAEGLFHSTDGGARFDLVSEAGAVYCVGFGKPAEVGGYSVVFATDGLKVRRKGDSPEVWVRIEGPAGVRTSMAAGDSGMTGRCYAVGLDGRVFVGDSRIRS